MVTDVAGWNPALRLLGQGQVVQDWGAGGGVGGAGDGDGHGGSKRRGRGLGRGGGVSTCGRLGKGFGNKGLGFCVRAVLRTLGRGWRG